MSDSDRYNDFKRLSHSTVATECRYSFAFQRINCIGVHCFGDWLFVLQEQLRRGESNQTTMASEEPRSIALASAPSEPQVNQISIKIEESPCPGDVDPPEVKLPSEPIFASAPSLPIDSPQVQKNDSKALLASAPGEDFEAYDPPPPEMKIDLKREISEATMQAIVISTLMDMGFADEAQATVAAFYGKTVDGALEFILADRTNLKHSFIPGDSADLCAICFQTAADHTARMPSPSVAVHDEKKEEFKPAGK
jgi:hypothetical protein